MHCEAQVQTISWMLHYHSPDFQNAKKQAEKLKSCKMKDEG